MKPIITIGSIIRLMVIEALDERNMEVSPADIDLIVSNLISRMNEETPQENILGHNAVKLKHLYRIPRIVNAWTAMIDKHEY